MGSYRRSSLVFDFGFSKRNLITQFLRYWDGDRLGLHDGDKKLLKSFENPKARPWIVLASFSETIGTVSKELLVMTPVASTPLDPDRPEIKIPRIRDIECFQLYRNFDDEFPKKDTCIRQMMATVAVAEEVTAGLTFGKFGGDPVFLDAFEFWEDFDTKFAQPLWTAERLAIRMRERLGALKHALAATTDKKEPSRPAMQPHK